MSLMSRLSCHNCGSIPPSRVTSLCLHYDALCYRFAHCDHYYARIYESVPVPITSAATLYTWVSMPFDVVNDFIDRTPTLSTGCIACLCESDIVQGSELKEVSAKNYVTLRAQDLWKLCKRGYYVRVASLIQRIAVLRTLKPDCDSLSVGAMPYLPWYNSWRSSDHITGRHVRSLLVGFL